MAGLVETSLEVNNYVSTSKKKRNFRQAHFLICNSCFWCSSYIDPNSVSISKCARCADNRIEWIPIPTVALLQLGYQPKEDNDVFTDMHTRVL